MQTPGKGQCPDTISISKPFKNKNKSIMRKMYSFLNTAKMAQKALPEALISSKAYCLRGRRKCERKRKAVSTL